MILKNNNPQYQAKLFVSTTYLSEGPTEMAKRLVKALSLHCQLVERSNTSTQGLCCSGSIRGKLPGEQSYEC